jgi:hypothetical protein
MASASGTGGLYGARVLLGTVPAFLQHLDRLVRAQRCDERAVAALHRRWTELELHEAAQRIVDAARAPRPGSMMYDPGLDEHERYHREYVAYVVERRPAYHAAAEAEPSPTPAPTVHDVVHTLRSIYGAGSRLGAVHAAAEAREAARCVVQLPLSACTSFKPARVSQRDQLRARGHYFSLMYAPSGDADVARTAAQLTLPGRTYASDARIDDPLHWPERPAEIQRRRWEVGDAPLQRAAVDAAASVIVFFARRRLLEHDLPLLLLPALVLGGEHESPPLAVRRHPDYNGVLGSNNKRRYDVMMRNTELARQPPLTPMLLHAFYEREHDTVEPLMLCMSSLAALLGVHRCYLPTPEMAAPVLHMDDLISGRATPTAAQRTALEMARHYRVLDVLMWRCYDTRAEMWQAIARTLEHDLSLDKRGCAYFEADAENLLVSLRAYLIYCTPPAEAASFVIDDDDVPSSSSFAASPLLSRTTSTTASSSAFASPRIARTPSGAAAEARRFDARPPGRMHHCLSADAVAVLRYTFLERPERENTGERMELIIEREQGIVFDYDAAVAADPRAKCFQMPFMEPMEEMWRRHPALGLFTMLAAARMDYARASTEQATGATASSASPLSSIDGGVADGGVRYIPVQDTVDAFVRDGRAVDVLVRPPNEESLRLAHYPWLSAAAVRQLREHSAFAALAARVQQSAPFALEFYQLIADIDAFDDAGRARRLLYGLTVRGSRARDRLGPLPTMQDRARLPVFIGADSGQVARHRYKQAARRVHPSPAVQHRRHSSAAPAISESLAWLFGFLERDVPLAVRRRRVPVRMPPRAYHFTPACSHGARDFMAAAGAEIAAGVPALHVFAVWKRPKTITQDERAKAAASAAASSSSSSSSSTAAGASAAAPTPQ